MSRVLVEIVCCSVADARATERGGGHRIELCSALESGGLTPSVGLLEQIKTLCSLPVMAMLRPRPGGFCYAPEEIAVMERDAKFLLAHGADGLVLGALTPQKAIEREISPRFLDIAGGKPVTFHRAFDITPNLADSLETLIELGFARVLTSGGAASAAAGADALCSLHRQAAGRIEILPGGGVRAENAAELIQRTNCSQIHLAPLKSMIDLTAAHGAIDYGGYRAVDEQAVRAVVQAVQAPQYAAPPASLA